MLFFPRLAIGRLVSPDWTWVGAGGARKGVTGGNKVGHDQIWSTATSSNNMVGKMGQMNFESESKFGKYICRCLICSEHGEQERKCSINVQ